MVAVDIANTAVARGKIYLARNRGEQIPDGWAMDSDGNVTTDPTDAINGVILPMAGHKGYAITFMMDVLSGALTGANTATRVGGPYEAERPSGAGHLFIAIDVAAMGNIDDYLASVGQLIDEVKNHATRPRQHRNLLPRRTRRPQRTQQSHRRRIVLPDQTRADLEDLGARLSITPTF